MAEGVDRSAVGDLNAWAEHDVRLDGYVAPQLRIIGEPHAFGIDERRALLQHLLAPAPLPLELEMRQLGAAVDPGRFIGVAFDDHRLATLARRDIDDVGQVIFVRGIVVADLAKPTEQVACADGHHPRIAQAHCALILGRVAELHHLGDAVALAKDDAPIFGRVGRA